jgi:hypothetical protein
MSLECGFEVIRESIWISFWFVDFAVFVRLLIVISVTAGFWFNIIGVPLVLFVIGSVDKMLIRL